MNSIVDKTSLPSANALMAGSSGFVMILGMSVGGIITAYLGVTAAFVINSLSFMVSAWLLRQGARVEQRPQIPGSQPAFWSELSEGFHTVIGSRPVSLLFLLEVGWSIGGGALNVLISIMANEVFKIGSIGVGSAYASLGVGTVLGSIVAARLSRFNIRYIRIAAGTFFVLDALLHIMFANSGSAIMGNMALAGAGLAGAIGSSAINTLLGICTDNRVQGRVFSLFNTIGSSLLSLSMAAVGILIPIYGTSTVGTTGGCIILCFAAVYLLLIGSEIKNTQMESDGSAARSAGKLS
jgi:predicted MFS family arabinose efflux permease